jgi:hypothetical protein
VPGELDGAGFMGADMPGFRRDHAFVVRQHRGNDDGVGQ